MPLKSPPAPQVQATDRVRNDVDRFVLAELERMGLSYRAEADRATLVRRVAFDLTGLPPTPEEISTYQNDDSADAYERMVDRYLGSPRYGQRWGKYWLDAAGYADSNGYFNADSDRPLAYRYRDYVVRVFNQDKPFDRFVIEQLAGDELAGFKPGEATTSEVISLLEATHYLRNGQDGTGESDGNDNEQTIDRFSALDSCLQIVSSSLLGLTIQCAKCHDHKFEPLSQLDYYRWQSVFYPAFNVKDWKKPNERVVQATLPGELEAWKAHEAAIDERASVLRREFTAWAKENQPRGAELFRDEFAAGGPPLGDAWSNTAPGDEQPAGLPAVNLDSETRPATIARDGNLFVLESGDAGDRVMSTRQSFNWSPQTEGGWIQITFDVVDVKVGESKICERLAYFLAVRDYNDTREGETGNVLLEGKPEGGGVGLYLDYPGDDHKNDGSFGEASYQGGHSYGVRVTRLADGKCRLDHLYDGVPDGKSATLDQESLGSGGFGFGLCCGRSFIVDNVVIAESQSGDLASDAHLQAETSRRRDELAASIKQLDGERTPEPGRIAWMSDRSSAVPEVHLLERGSHSSPGAAVEPAPLTALSDPNAAWRLAAAGVRRPDHRPASGLGPVGDGCRCTVGGPAGARAGESDLAAALRRGHRRDEREPGRERRGCPRIRSCSSTWQQSLSRAAGASSTCTGVMLGSAAYRQASTVDEAAFKARSRQSAAVAVDAPAAGRRGGARRDAGHQRRGSIVDGRTLRANQLATGWARLWSRLAPRERMRRSLYLQQRRTQTLSLLGVFDSPSLVVNCVRAAGLDHSAAIAEPAEFAASCASSPNTLPRG